MLVLELAPKGFAELRDALGAAADDPAVRPKMPLLIDVRTEVPGVRYEDVQHRVAILSQMRRQLGSRWAILTGPEAVPVGLARMYAVFSEIAGLEARIFADEAAAFTWLGAKDTPLQQLQRVWQKVLDDPNATAGNRRHAEWKLENLRRSEEGEPPLPVPEELRDPDSPNWSSTLYLIEHSASDLE